MPWRARNSLRLTEKTGPKPLIGYGPSLGVDTGVLNDFIVWLTAVLSKG
jgi:hypothetical protein